MPGATAQASRSDGDFLVVYSTNTVLAYEIGEQYYGGVHFVWCTPCFDARKVNEFKRIIPPSSNPWEIYRQLHEDVVRSDLHSSRISQNRLGLLRGADHKFKIGRISAKQRRDIRTMVLSAETVWFRPLLYVIPYLPVRHLWKAVAIEKRATPLSMEHRIEKLPRKLFDPLEIELGWS